MADSVIVVGGSVTVPPPPRASPDDVGVGRSGGACCIYHIKKGRGCCLGPPKIFLQDCTPPSRQCIVDSRLEFMISRTLYMVSSVSTSGIGGGTSESMWKEGEQDQGQV